MKSKTLLILFICAAFCLAAFSASATTIDPANATYKGIAEGAESITLKNGSWEGKFAASGGTIEAIAGLMKDFRLTGDLTGDGKPEVAVILWQNSGGTGVFYYLAVLAEKNNKADNIATVLLGDRVEILGGEIRDGEIALKILRQGPKDPLCCPSQKVLQTWTLKEGKLIPGKTKVLGKFTLADLGGTIWRLERLRWKDKPLPATPRITLVFQGGKATGVAGCNRYAGKVQMREDIVGEIKITALLTTKKMCDEKVMALERRYLELLKGVMSFGFTGKRLELTYKVGNVIDTMSFVPSSAQGK